MAYSAAKAKSAPWYGCSGVHCGLRVASSGPINAPPMEPSRIAETAAPARSGATLSAAANRSWALNASVAPTRQHAPVNSQKCSSSSASAPSSALPTAPTPPRTKPMRRPTRCINRAVGTVAAAVPTTMNESGSVASAGLGAKSLPTMPPTVTTSTVPEVKTSCARKYSGRLRAAMRLDPLSDAHINTRRASGLRRGGTDGRSSEKGVHANKTLPLLARRQRRSGAPSRCSVRTAWAPPSLLSECVSTGRRKRLRCRSTDMCCTPC